MHLAAYWQQDVVGKSVIGRGFMAGGVKKASSEWLQKKAEEVEIGLLSCCMGGGSW